MSIVKSFDIFETLAARPFAPPHKVLWWRRSVKGLTGEQSLAIFNSSMKGIFENCIFGPYEFMEKSL